MHFPSDKNTQSQYSDLNSRNLNANSCLGCFPVFEHDIITITNRTIINHSDITSILTKHSLELAKPSGEKVSQQFWTIIYTADTSGNILNNLSTDVKIHSTNYPESQRWEMQYPATTNLHSKQQL